MKIINEPPPNIEILKKVFPIRSGVLFSWGDRIYNPDGIDIPEELIVHEEIHGARQINDIEGWWEKYIEDPAFRLQEEIPAHQAEYLHLYKTANRQTRRRALVQIANRLSSPLYGKMLKPAEAKRIIKKALNGET